ncbi:MULTISPECIES: FtsB family cell division protein [Frankia]|uniref:Septum formation initiator family protein n=1 Tax=Frankia umida TaxID=573489 RepID=A0ABT0K0A4_9ACTN|nr:MULTISPECIES: septum formation initiator family protein [Frankia]MCK9877208.1 septum formation initiator family protein [Frankia umida]
MPAPRVALTTRATLLAVVICVLVLTLAYPLRLYLRQQSKLSQLVRANAQAQTQVDQLRTTVGRYGDQAWVEDEARRRLHYLKPGEQAYLMPAPATPPSTDEAHGGASAGDSAWYGRLWSQISAP